jgi:hypothetical protein
MSRRASMPIDAQGNFVAVPPRASPVAAYLSPECPEEAPEAGAVAESTADAPDSPAPRAVPKSEEPGPVAD